MKYLLIAALCFLPSQAFACSFKGFSDAKEYVDLITSDEDLSFIGRVKVKERVEIDKYVFHQFEVEQDLLQTFSGDKDKYFVGYTNKPEILENNTAAQSSCDISKGFEIGSSPFLVLYSLKGFKNFEPYRIDMSNTYLGGFKPEEIEKQIKAIQEKEE